MDPMWRSLLAVLLLFIGVASTIPAQARNAQWVVDGRTSLA